METFGRIRKNLENLCKTLKTSEKFWKHVNNWQTFERIWKHLGTSGEHLGTLKILDLFYKIWENQGKPQKTKKNLQKPEKPENQKNQDI